MKTLTRIFKILKSDKQGEDFPCRETIGRFLSKLSNPRKKEKEEALKEENLGELKDYQELVKKEPWNPNVRLKLAKIYERKGEKQKAIAEYFLVAEIFSKNGFYPHAMEIYKLVQEQDQSLDLVSLKIANTYQKMDLLEEAFSQYSQLLHHYHDLGLKEKTQEIMTLMAEFEQKKFEPDERAYLKYRLVKEFSNLQEEKKEDVGLLREENEEFFDLSAELEKISKPVKFEGLKEISTEKVCGFGEILKELKGSVYPDEVYPNFNYHMGMACLEMGFIDEAIGQFQVAIEKGQNPFEAAKLLDTCLTEKGLWGKPAQSTDQVLQKKGSPKGILEVDTKSKIRSPQEGNNLNESPAGSLLPVRAKA